MRNFKDWHVEKKKMEDILRSLKEGIKKTKEKVKDLRSLKKTKEKMTQVGFRRFYGK